MKETYTIPLSSLIDEFGLTPVYLPDDAEKLLISNTEVNRPGLALAGFFEKFERTRIQLIGIAEYRYLEERDEARRHAKIDDLFRHKPVAVILTTDLAPFPRMKEMAEANGVPLLIAREKTSPFMAALIAFLNVQLAPRITRHGVLIEVYGEGLLILGDSGVGKSETAIELVKRGHRLIADDAVEIRRVSKVTLVSWRDDL